MKRTGVTILGVLGVIFSLLFLIGGIFRLVFQYNNQVQEQFYSIAKNAKLEESNINTVVEMLSSGGWLISIASLLSLILGIIAITNLRQNKNNKQIGVLFILGAITIGGLTLGTGLFPAIFYLLAGIIVLTRKPKNESQIIT